jgi:hypothetical protein
MFLYVQQGTLSLFEGKNLLLAARWYTENTVAFPWQQLFQECATLLVIHTLLILFVFFPALVCDRSKALLMWVIPDKVYQRIIKSAHLFIVKTVPVFTVRYVFQSMRL